MNDTFHLRYSVRYTFAMDKEPKHQVGQIGWLDLTVPDAPAIRDFYRQIVGWRAEPVEMGDYSDYNMIPAGSEQPTAGICHARGVNADMPPVWMIYIIVENLKASMRKCVELGGRIVLHPGHWGEEAQICIIQDPAGAYAALYQP